MTTLAFCLSPEMINLLSVMLVLFSWIVCDVKKQTNKQTNKQTKHTGCHLKTVNNPPSTKSCKNDLAVRGWFWIATQSKTVVSDDLSWASILWWCHVSRTWEVRVRLDKNMPHHQSWWWQDWDTTTTTTTWTSCSMTHTWWWNTHNGWLMETSGVTKRWIHDMCIVHSNYSMDLSEEHRLWWVRAKWHGRESHECHLTRLTTMHDVLHTTSLSILNKHTSASEARQSQRIVRLLSADSWNHCGQSLHKQTESLWMALTLQTQHPFLEGTLLQPPFRRRNDNWCDIAYSVVYMQARVRWLLCNDIITKAIPLSQWLAQCPHLARHANTIKLIELARIHRLWYTQDCPSRTRDGWMGWHWQLLMKHPITLNSTPSTNQNPPSFSLFSPSLNTPWLEAISR